LNITAGDDATLATTNDWISGNKSAIILELENQFGANDTELENKILTDANLTVNNSHVSGPTSATADAIAIFSGATGRLLKDGLKTIVDLTADIVNQVLVIEAGNRTTDKAILFSGVNTNLTVKIYAQSMWPDGNGATVTAPNLTPNGPTIVGLDFPTVTKSDGINATGNFIWPKNFGTGTVTAVFYGTAPLGNSGTVILDMRGVCLANASSPSQGWGTNQSVSVTISSGQFWVTAATPAITFGGSPGSGVECWAQTRRLGGTAGTVTLTAEEITIANP